MLVPKLVTTLQTYNREQFIADLRAGVIVGIVARPLAIAFAIASGVTPDRGPSGPSVTWRAAPRPPGSAWGVRSRAPSRL